MYLVYYVENLNFRKMQFTLYEQNMLSNDLSLTVYRICFCFLVYVDIYILNFGIILALFWSLHMNLTKLVK